MDVAVDEAWRQVQPARVNDACGVRDRERSGWAGLYDRRAIDEDRSVRSRSTGVDVDDCAILKQ